MEILYRNQIEIFWLVEERPESGSRSYQDEDVTKA